MDFEIKILPNYITFTILLKKSFKTCNSLLLVLLSTTVKVNIQKEDIYEYY